MAIIFGDMMLEISGSAGSFAKVSTWVFFMNHIFEILSNLFVAVFGLPFEMAKLIPLDAIPMLISVPDITDIDDSWCADDMMSDSHVNVIEFFLIYF